MDKIKEILRKTISASSFDSRDTKIWGRDDAARRIHRLIDKEKAELAFVTNAWGVVGVHYRLFPGGVECVLTYMDETGFSEAKGWISAPESQIESYDRQRLSMQALTKATVVMNDQLSALNDEIEKHYEALKGGE